MMTNLEKAKTQRSIFARLARATGAEVRAVLSTHTAGAALRAGSGIVVRWAWARIAPFSPMWERLAWTGGGLYAAIFIIAKAPQIVVAFAGPGAVLAWCVAAWTVAPPIAPEPKPVEGQLPDPADAFRLWLLQLIGTRPGIHLRELYPAMRSLPGHEQLTDAQLRAALRTLAIPVSRSVRIGALAGRSGVYRDALAPLPSPSGEPRVERGGDAGQSADSPPGEPLESGVDQLGERTP